MSTPLPAEIILPTGEPAYLNPYRGTYTTKRDYALRMQRNYGRGIPQAEARGHGVSPTGLTESQIRAQRFLQRYGFSENQWRRWRRKYIAEINETRASEYAPGQTGNPITVEAIAQDIAANQQRVQIVPGIIIPPENYTENRLAELLYEVREYRAGNKLPGRQSFYARESYRPIELWWYH